MSSEARVRAGMVHIPLPGSDGILVLIGGGQKPSSNLEHDWKGMFLGEALTCKDYVANA